MAGRRIAVGLGTALALALAGPGGARLGPGLRRRRARGAGRRGGSAERTEGKQGEKPKKTWGKKEKKGSAAAQTVRERTGKRLLTAQEHFQAEPLCRGAGGARASSGSAA